MECVGSLLLALVLMDHSLAQGWLRLIDYHSVPVALLSHFSGEKHPCLPVTVSPQEKVVDESRSLNKGRNSQQRRRP